MLSISYHTQLIDSVSRITWKYDNTATLNDVFRDLNEQENKVENEDIIESVRTHADEETAQKVREMSQTSEPLPEMWGAETHEETFGYEPNQEEPTQDDETDTTTLIAGLAVLGVFLFTGFIGVTVTIGGIGYGAYKLYNNQ